MHGVSYQGKAASESARLVGCGQVFFSSNQTAVFFDKYYHWKEAIDTDDVLLGDNYQGIIKDDHFLLGVTKHASSPIMLQDSV